MWIGCMGGQIPVFYDCMTYNMWLRYCHSEFCSSLLFSCGLQVCVIPMLRLMMLCPITQVVLTLATPLKPLMLSHTRRIRSMISRFTLNSVVLGRKDINSLVQSFFLVSLYKTNVLLIIWENPKKKKKQQQQLELQNFK